METENQNNSNAPFLSKVKPYFVMYGDLAIRSVISFGIMMGFFALLSFVFHLKPVVNIVIAFFFAIIIGPLLGRIRLTEKMLNKYDSYLDNLFKDKRSKK